MKGVALDCPMPHAELLADYDRHAPALARHGEAMRAQLEAWLRADDQLKLHSVTLRVKSRASLARKLARPDRTYARLWDVTDLVGLRVITYFEDGVDRVGKLVEARLPVDFHHSTDKRARGDASRFGYRSLHYVCRAPAADLPEDARYEIQARTLLEHAWAEIEHDLGYKSRDAVPADVRRRLNRLAGLLELADQEFVAIRRELTAYADALPQLIASADAAVPLDALSLRSLLECAEARTLDDQIAQRLGKALGDEPFYPDYLVRMLASSGITSVGAARSGLERHGRAIVGMVQPYFAFASSTWRLSPDGMERILRGYSLFFLAHATVLETQALGINKVERLAHLYRELDYPDDERAAQRVASQLVDAFREIS
jgi:ppGpp synthetase/RelA/SpoT-type nucleotidyltranferase